MTDNYNFNSNNISDMQLMAYADNELNDNELIAIIESSSELQNRLIPFIKTAPLIDQLSTGLMNKDIPEKFALDNMIRMTKQEQTEVLLEDDELSSELQAIDDQVTQLNTGILNEPIPDALKAILNNELKKNKTNKVAQLWPEKLKISLGSILTLEQSPAFYGMAASMLLAVGVYFNIQNTSLEWQNRYAALGYETDFIDSSEWYMSTDNVENYSMPNAGSNDLTVKVSNLNTINTNEDVNAQEDNQEVNDMTILDQQLMTIDANLSGRYLIGVFHDMSSKEIPIARVYKAGNESLNLRLYGKNASKDNCILGEIIYKPNVDSDNSINSKFFNFCAFDTANPLQLID